jgi:hypothetical protein
VNYASRENAYSLHVVDLTDLLPTGGDIVSFELVGARGCRIDEFVEIPVLAVRCGEQVVDKTGCRREDFVAFGSIERQLAVPVLEPGLLDERGEIRRVIDMQMR